MNVDVDEHLIRSLTRASDQLVPATLERADDLRAAAPADGPPTAPKQWAQWSRRLLTSFVAAGSAYHHDDTLVERGQRLVDAVADAQHDDGTFSLGNLRSVPDTAFVIEELAVVASIMRRDEHAASASLATRLQRIIERAGPALVTGGVHTPNHRWALCAALARIDQVAPDPAYRARIEEWLAEGIDQDQDGQYSERSPHYAARVTNPCLLTLAWLLDRPQLRDHVRRNLALILSCTEPDGQVDSVFSRRQDQDHRTVRLADFYLQLREIALHDRQGLRDEAGQERVGAAGGPEGGHGREYWAAVVAEIERREGPPVEVLGAVLERRELAAPLPAGMSAPARHTTIVPNTGLVRLRRDETTVTVFGGTDDYDQAATMGSSASVRIGSGLSTNPTFVRLHHGRAVLESVRMSTAFFGLGHFRGRGVENLGTGRFRLRDRLRVPYYGPLPSAARRDDADYDLEYDGRFFSAMSFSQRPRTEQVLRRQVTVSEVVDTADGARFGLDLEFAVEESEEVAVTIELCFRPGGSFTNVRTVGTRRMLVAGTGGYAVGDDRIEFGPGNGIGVVDPDPGEQYRAHGGNRSPDGDCVYLTGVTPLHYTLRLRCH